MEDLKPSDIIWYAEQEAQHRQIIGHGWPYNLTAPAAIEPEQFFFGYFLF